MVFLTLWAYYRMKFALDGRMKSDISFLTFIQTVLVDDILHVCFQLKHSIIRELASKQHGGDYQLGYSVFLPP